MLAEGISSEEHSIRREGLPHRTAPWQPGGKTAGWLGTVGIGANLVPKCRITRAVIIIHMLIKFDIKQKML